MPKKDKLGQFLNEKAKNRPVSQCAKPLYRLC